MCRFKSGIILKNRIVLAPKGNESHSDLLENLGIEDNYLNASKTFIRAELTTDNKASDVKEWKYIVDQDVVPDWYMENEDKYESDFREAVAEWVKDNFVFMCGRAWEPIKTDENGTYYLMADSLMDSIFGKTNKYKDSDVRKKLAKSDLAAELKREFGDKIVLINGDILSIPTRDLYEECGNKITKLDSWWLSTPYSVSCVQYVYSYGCVGYDIYCYYGGVRPVLILKS